MVDGHRELAFELAELTAGLRPSDLPRAVEQTVRADVLDTLGCALAGTGARGVGELVELLASWGGTPESAVWGTGLRLPAPPAALANGTAAHALDFDDTHDAAVLHAGVTVVPAALAAAQRRGALPWEELLCAIASGLEVACRIGAATTAGPGQSGWLLTPLCGTFGAAAAAARAVGCDAERTLHALGIAYAQAAGNGQATLDRALTKRMQAGFAARSGVLAAVLAKTGITGATEPLEGPRGYFRVYHGGGYSHESARDELGEHFLLEQLSFKRYPCCRWTHAAIDAALECRQRGLSADDVEAIQVHVSRQAYASTSKQPTGSQDAAGVVSAQFSIPYAVAVALLEGPPRLEHFTEAAVGCPEFLALASRVAVEVDADPERASQRRISSATLVARRRSADTIGARVNEPAGMGIDIPALRRKFIDCCAYVGIPAETAADRANELLGAPQPDVVALAAALRPRVLG